MLTFAACEDTLIPELIACRTSVRPAGTSAVWHCHHLIQVGYVTEGQVLVDTPERKLVLGAGDFYMLVANHLHRVQNKEDMTKYVAYFDPTDRPRRFPPGTTRGSVFARLLSRSLVIRQEASLGRWLGEVDEWWDEGMPDRQLVAAGLALRVLASLDRFDSEEIGGPSAQPTGRGQYARFLEAVQAIHRMHPKPGLTVADIAQALHVSRSWLYKLFHRQLGYGPQTFLRRYRVDRAKELILQGHHPMKTIARDTGFADVYTFSRTFKQVAGVPPGQYARRSVGESTL
jgi:AraC-like DNA-binding protein